MCDAFANLWGALGCLGVALMLAAVPILGALVAILSLYIRRSSAQARSKFERAGALATEVISGVKTVASLCVEPWAILSLWESRAGGAEALYLGRLSERHGERYHRVRLLCHVHGGLYDRHRNSHHGAALRWQRHDMLVWRDP